MGKLHFLDLTICNVLVHMTVDPKQVKSETQCEKTHKSKYMFCVNLNIPAALLKLIIPTILNYLKPEATLKMASGKVAQSLTCANII